jgi:hypothetical protein
VAADAPLRYSEHQLPIRKPEARCKAWPRHLHCRRRTHKAFLRWYSENEPKFAIKLELLRRTDTDLDIGFCRIDRIVTASLVDDEIIIAVMWEGECWDMLRDFETYPKRVRDGYVCDECPEKHRLVFPSRDGLWRTEVFDPFLEWVNDDLVNAVAVSISGTPGSGTWARLVRGSDGCL